MRLPIRPGARPRKAASGAWLQELEAAPFGVEGGGQSVNVPHFFSEQQPTA